MSRSEPPPRRRYEALRARAAEDFYGGHPQRALLGLDRALRVAERTGDDDLIGVALANRTTAAVEVERHDALPSPHSLRDALARCSHRESRYRVAHALHAVYHARGDLRKSLFYSRTAFQLAPPELEARAAHNLGGELIARGDVEAALPLIHQARSAWPAEVPLALSTSLLAYAHALAGDRRAARRHALRALEEALAEPTPVLYRSPIRLNVGYALLECGEAEGAYDQANEAERAVAEAGKDLCHEHKMALYLGAEAAFDIGREDDGEALAERLCVGYYPDARGLGELLRAISTYRLVNWLA
jgi:tetratricopeptide (TPR) repeat protein